MVIRPDGLTEVVTSTPPGRRLLPGALHGTRPSVVVAVGVVAKVGLDKEVAPTVAVPGRLVATPAPVADRPVLQAKNF